MHFRHEMKIEISYMDLLTLRQRLGAVMRIDPHTVGNSYSSRSLYFDTPQDRALREKIDGVNFREKFRIRYYNGSTDLIHLEKKSKLGGLCSKETTHLTAKQVQRLLEGDLNWMPSEGGLTAELYYKMRSQLLSPKIFVQYTREPFVYSPGNVRVTLDYNIRTGLDCSQFLDWSSPTIPAGDAPILLEVKWDEFLPDCIRSAVQLGSRNLGAFSKYAQCRIYG